MCTYLANDTTLSSLLEGSNPKTISKYVWPFIRSFFALNTFMVNWLLYLVLLNELSLTFLFDFRFNLKTGRRETLEMTVCFWLMQSTSGLRWATQSLFGATSSRRVVYIMRWGCASWRETFAGQVGLMYRVSGMTCQFSGTLWYPCWSLGSGVRWIGATKALSQPTSNAQVFWRQTQTLWKNSNGYGAGRRLSMSTSRIGQFCWHCTVTTCWNTKQFLVLLSFSPSFLLWPTLCLRLHINY